MRTASAASFIVKDQTREVRGSQDRPVRRRAHRDSRRPDGRPARDHDGRPRACATATASRWCPTARAAAGRTGGRAGNRGGRRRQRDRRAGPGTIEAAMSIPRTAIQRPVTMFMLSAVIVLLGAISLFRLPVDLMPDVTYPTITRARGLRRRRPGRDRTAHRAAARAVARGGARPRADQLHRVGRIGQRAPELRVGHEPQRSRRRSPHAHGSRARPPAGRIRSAEHLEIRLGCLPHHGHRRRGRLRSRDAARNGRDGHRAAARARGRRGGRSP